MKVSASNAVKATRRGLRNLFRRSELSIGTRLGACFVAIVVVMIAVDGLAVWQFRRMAAATERLSNADQVSLAVIRVHLDIDTLRGKVAALASTRDTHQFASEVASLEQTFLQDVEHAERVLSTSPEIEQDAAISSALEALKVTLPSQLHTAAELANAGDWTAVRLRLEQQIQDLIDLSASLVERVDRQMLRARTQAIQNTQQARQNLFIVGPIAGLLALLAAAALGWYVTRTITVPLSELTAGAAALARGDFQHRLEVFGNDELAVLAKAFNYAARQLQELYQGLRRSETELRDLIENVPAMVFIALPGPSNAFASRRWREYTGLSQDDTSGSGWQSVVHPEDLGRHMEKWRACSAIGEPFEDEARFRRAADGEYRWFLARAVPLRDEAGNILKWYGVLTDIEDRKRGEQALTRSEAYLAEAQRLKHTGSFAYDAKTNTFPYWSEEHFRIWGFDPQQNPPDGDTLLQRVHAEDRVMVRQRLEKALRQRKDYTAEFRIVLPDGTVKYIEAIGHHVSTVRGEPVEVVGTHVDVTDRKHAEEERERLQRLEAELAHTNRVSMLGELTASLAHEINQPISAAITSAGACLRWLNRDQPEVQRAREAAMRIEHDGRRAAEIINHLKSFYKKDTSPQRETVAVNEVVGEMLVLLHSEADRHSVVMRTELAADVPLVRADRVQLQQVLMNLMLNGMEAMSGAGGELKVRTRRGEGEVLVSVSDTGEGIPADKVEQIFNAFFTTKAGGTGMGLAISRTIVESHGGRLWAEANAGRGATFHFTLPTQPEANK